MGRASTAVDEAQSLRPSKRPKDWGAELPEDPILSSQTSSPPLIEKQGVAKALDSNVIGLHRTASSPSSEPVQGAELPRLLQGNLKKQRRSSRPVQPKPTLHKEKTYNILVALGVTKRKGLPEKQPALEQRQDVEPDKRPPENLPTSARAAKSRPRSQKRAGRRSRKEIDDLRYVAQAKAPADVEAIVEAVGDLEMQELPLQPGEFVSTRMLKVRRMNAKEANCWRLWAMQAESNGTELIGERVLIRSTRVHEVDGRIEFTGCEAIERAPSAG